METTKDCGFAGPYGSEVHIIQDHFFRHRAACTCSVCPNIPRIGIRSCILFIITLDMLKHWSRAIARTLIKEMLRVASHHLRRRSAKGGKPKPARSTARASFDGAPRPPHAPKAQSSGAHVHAFMWLGHRGAGMCSARHSPTVCTILARPRPDPRVPTPHRPPSIRRAR